MQYLLLFSVCLSICLSSWMGVVDLHSVFPSTHLRSCFSSSLITPLTYSCLKPRFDHQTSPVLRILSVRSTSTPSCLPRPSQPPSQLLLPGFSYSAQSFVFSPACFCGLNKSSSFGYTPPKVSVPVFLHSGFSFCVSPRGVLTVTLLLSNYAQPKA